MTRLFAAAAFLPDGWASDVAIDVDATGTITAVTPGSAPTAGDTRLTGPVLPGMPNVHSHAFQRAMAGLAERVGGAAGDDFWSWRQTMYGFVAKLDPDGVGAIAAQLYLEMLRRGYTAVGEFHYLHNQPDGTPYADPTELSERVIDAAKRAGIGISHLPVLYVQGGFDGKELSPAQRRFRFTAEGLLDMAGTVAKRHADDPNITVGVAPHSIRAVDPASLKAVVAGTKARDAGAPIHIHIAEQPLEVNECIAWSGRRSVQWLLDECPVDDSWCLVHATHVDEAEVAGMVKAQAVVGLCPTTEANLGDGLFPLIEFHGQGGAWGIGSDSHITVSPAEELRLAEYGQRLIKGRRALLGSLAQPSVGGTLYARTLEGGAQALGRKLGRIAAGHRADLVTLDPDHPQVGGRFGDAWIDSFVFADDGRMVRDVWVGGRQVIAEGHHRDEQAIGQAWRKTLAQLTS